MRADTGIRKRNKVTKPDRGDDFLALVAARRDALSPSEQRVADAVLDQPDKIIRMSIATLAEAVGVSQPTVLRFARAMGLAGYPELKLRTGQSLVGAGGTPYVHSAVAPDDALDRIVDKVLGSSIHALEALRHGLDVETLDRVITALATAPRIDCYGVGSASALSSEAQLKLMRFGIPVVTYPDTHLQRLAAASLRAGDVALCFSYSGMIRDIEAIAKGARRSGATVISVTRPDTALARASHIVVAVAANENTEIYAPMVSRVAHTALLDIIATSIALRGGQKMLARLRRAKDSLSDLRLHVSHA